MKKYYVKTLIEMLPEEGDDFLDGSVGDMVLTPLPGVEIVINRQLFEIKVGNIIVAKEIIDWEGVYNDRDFIPKLSDIEQNNLVLDFAEKAWQRLIKRVLKEVDIE